MQKQLEKRISKQGISHQIQEEAFLQHINYPRAGINIRQPAMLCCASEIKGGVVQRALFIRKSPESVTKDRKKMGARVTGVKKAPQPVAADSGYVKITDATVQMIIKGYQKWLQANILGGFQPDMAWIADKVAKMMHKAVTSQQPETTYGERGSVLQKEDQKYVSYYFDSLEEFYQYLYVSESGRILDKSGSEHNLQRPQEWTKINVVNVGAGDAIVMALPTCYLIVDLGTNLGFLLDYLALRNNKYAGTRGIPLISTKSYVVITHDHTDHEGVSKRSQFPEELRSQIIVGYKEYTEKKEDDQAFQKLNTFLADGGFRVYELPECTNDKPNPDSLVIARTTEKEAIILCGDQEPDRLIWVIENLINEKEKTLEHIFVKISHHGSCENSPLRVIDALGRLGRTADFVVSSGSKYNHPTGGAFLTEVYLHKQGTEIKYPVQFPDPDYAGEDQDVLVTEERAARLFYTANLNPYGWQTSLGSVAYKSNGVSHAAYSKRYTDEETVVANMLAENEVYDVVTMLQTMFGKYESEELTVENRIIRFSDYSRSENAQFFLQAFQENGEQLLQLLTNYVEYIPEIIPDIFGRLSRDYQEGILKIAETNYGVLDLLIVRLDFVHMAGDFSDVI